MATTLQVMVEPLANVRLRKDAGGTHWEAEDNDPQFAIRPVCAELFPLSPGWYRFRVHLGAGAPVRAPCLYVDHGQGISERAKIALPLPDRAGLIDAVLLFEQPVHAIRFDPSNRAARFMLNELELARRGRTWAFLAMLRAVTRASALPAWRVAGGAVGRFVLHALSGGLKEGVEYLRMRYALSQESPGDEYRDWVRQYDTIDADALANMQARVAALPQRPLISILLPTYNSPEKWLRRAIDSVLEQVYPEWELCIADDASTQDHVRRVLEQCATRDSRIRVLFREQNGHISAASNSALTLASGEYVALLDHDDELPPNALLEVAEAAVRHPDWQLIYSDEDKMDEFGRRFDPYFKPDWNYDLFLGQNCISHLGVYCTRLVRELGGFREGFEGSQDWDLALRVAERLAPGQIGHIPKVLYHWRAISGSTALGAGQKDYANEAGRRAVAEHLQRTGCSASVEVLPNTHMRIRRRLPVPPPRVSLVIPTRDRVDLLRTCVQSILEKTDYPEYEVLIVDNQSVEPETLRYFATLGGDPRVRVLRYDAPFNYSALNNFAVVRSSGDIVGLINNDIEVISTDWLQEMAVNAARPDVGAVGAMLYYPDNTIQHAGVVTGIGGVAGHIHVGRRRRSDGQMSRLGLLQELSAVTAACLLVRRSVYEAVGGLDENLRVAFNDVDFCLRVRRAGYRNLWTPFAELYHHESASRGYEDTPEKRARFQEEVDYMIDRWGDELTRDPAYNPNLSLTEDPFSLAFPPRT